MSNCLACTGTETKIILDFGPQPAANLLPDGPNAPVRRVPLVLRFCNVCGHGQQDRFHSPDELFSNYLYQSGTTQTLSHYFKWLAERIMRTCSPSDHVLELASNDGSFLLALRRQGLDCSGVEPAGNLVSLCRAHGLKVHHAFWPHVLLESKVARVVAMNVLAHVPDPHRFLLGIRENLVDDGIAFIQVSQANMFANNEFDTLYHEHFSFFCPSSLSELAKRCGFTKMAFCNTDVHGTSTMALFGFEGSPIESALSGLLEGSFALGQCNSDKRPTQSEAEAFQNHAQQICDSVLSLGKLAQESGRKFVLVGAAAKAITVYQASGAKFDRVIDEAPLKIGRYIPGTDIKIASFADMANEEAPCLFIIGAWNFRGEIEDKLKTFRGIEMEDLSAVYFPTLRIAPLYKGEM